MKKNKLTLKVLESIYQEALKVHEPTFPAWKTSFLWALWLLKGYTVTSENWRLYWVEFRNVKYLIKSVQL